MKVSIVRNTFKTQCGFTIIEIIAVLIILGIMAAVAVSRSTNYGTEVFTSVDALKNHLRYAQTTAMNHNLDDAGNVIVWGIKSSGGKYWLFQGADPDNTSNFIRLPDDEKYINDDRTINLGAKKITVSDFTIYFDDYGIPYSAINTPLTASSTINVSGGSSSRTVTITPLTGFIP